MEYVLEKEEVDNKQYQIAKLSENTQSKLVRKHKGVFEFRIAENVLEGKDERSAYTVFHEMGHFFHNKEHPLFFKSLFITGKLFWYGILPLFFLLFGFGISSLGKIAGNYFYFEKYNGFLNEIHIKELLFIFFCIMCFHSVMKYFDEKRGDCVSLRLLEKHFLSSIKHVNASSKRKSALLSKIKEEFKENKYYYFIYPIFIFLVWFVTSLLYFASFLVK